MKLILVDRTVVWERPIVTGLGFLRLDPAGKELWRTDRGYVLWPLITGFIYIHDPESGNVVDSISLFGYLSEERPLSAREIVFTPDGQKAYVAASHTSYSPGPVIVINTRTRTVAKLVLDDYEHYPYHVDIGPAP